MILLRILTTVITIYILNVNFNLYARIVFIFVYLD
jgi:hypothetical protein